MVFPKIVNVLGPTLFLVFFNDLPDVIEVLIKLFADDAKIYAVVSNQAAVNRVQTSLNKTFDWAEIWQMLFILFYFILFIFFCVEVLRPSQPNGVMSSGRERMTVENIT